MKHIIGLLVIFVTLAAGGAVAEAQQTKKIPRLGWLEISSPNPEVLRLIGLFRKGLRDLGWFEGQNLAIEFRYAEGKAERPPELAAELVRLKVDLIATHSGRRSARRRKPPKPSPLSWW